MNRTKFLAVMMLLSSVVAMQSFGQKAKGKMNKKAKIETTTATYTCSMHPEITGKKGEKCPKCGMKLVEKKAEVKQKVAVAKYICPMKCEGSASDKPGECPKCGMKLVALENKKELH